jgi:hypothetical protein
MSSSHVDGQELYGLTSPLESLLTSGGDPRLRLDPANLLNGYGCQPWPRPEAFTFASSTATSISDRGFAAAAEAQQRLLESARSERLEETCDREAEWLREQIKTFLNLRGSGTAIVFSPSGTDSQVHALCVAQTVLQGALVSVIVGSDETGSGTNRAMIGCHFSSGTAQGGAVIEGERIAGFAEDTVRMEIPLRDQRGRLRPGGAVDQEVIAVVEQSVASGKSVVLHVLDRSKLGSRCPSSDCLREVQSRWGGCVQVVVDACQMRLGRRKLQSYLDQNCMVLITGSKFFTGPPLSGALLIPASASAMMKKAAMVPAGLELYTNRNDWPVSWHGVRSKLPARPNLGQLLRWVAAVEEMRAFFGVPESYRSLALQEFSGIIPRLIAERPNLHLLPPFEQAPADGFDDEMAARTIFPFFISHRGKLLSVEACGRIYRALNRDVSNLLRASATARQRKAAARPCHIGQPVGMPNPTCGAAGTLRISAGARVVSETWGTAEAASRRKLAREFEQVRTILDKIDFLVQHLDMLTEWEENSRRPAIREARPVPFSTEVATMARSKPSPKRLQSALPIARTSGIKL